MAQCPCPPTSPFHPKPYKPPYKQPPTRVLSHCSFPIPPIPPNSFPLLHRPFPLSKSSHFHPPRQPISTMCIRALCTYTCTCTKRGEYISVCTAGDACNDTTFCNVKVREPCPWHVLKAAVEKERGKGRAMELSSGEQKGELLRWKGM